MVESPDVAGPGGDVDLFGPATTRAMDLAHDVALRIVRLELAPGASITEAELAAEAGTSKPTAREALQRLLYLDLVVPRRGAGYIVADITLGRARDLCHWWAVNIVEAAALAASNVTDPESIRVLAARIDTAVTADLELATGAIARETLLGTLSMSPAFTLALTQSWSAIAQVEHLAARVRPITPHPPMSEVLLAIAERDVEGARTRMQRRTDDFRRQVVDALLTLVESHDANLAEGF